MFQKRSVAAHGQLPGRVKPRNNSTMGGIRNMRNRNESHLVITEHKGHSAAQVCNSKSSSGWDVVSLEEKKFCDISNKKLYDLCDKKKKTGCFDVNKRLLVQGGLHTRSPGGFPKKQYKTSSHWTLKGNKRFTHS